MDGQQTGWNGIVSLIGPGSLAWRAGWWCWYFGTGSGLKTGAGEMIYQPKVSTAYIPTDPLRKPEVAEEWEAGPTSHGWLIDCGVRSTSEGLV